MVKNLAEKVYEEHKLILELLEQEPCEDAIPIPNNVTNGDMI